MTLDPKLWLGHSLGPWQVDGMYCLDATGERVLLSGTHGLGFASAHEHPERKANAALVFHAPQIEAERVRLLAENEQLRHAVEQALWHLGSDADRTLLCIGGKGWKTSKWEAADLARAALEPTP